MRNRFHLFDLGRSRSVLLAAVAGVPLLGGLRADAAVPAPGSWALTFDDEFNGNSLDQMKWNYGFYGSDPTTHGLADDSVEDVANVSVGGGSLSLNATNQGQWLNNNWYNYSSGAVNTNGKLNFTYGYFEASQKMPSQQGAWPAFWTEQPSGWPPEIDVQEVPEFSSNESAYWATYHYGTYSYPAGAPSVGTGSYGTGINLSNSFNNYGCDWEPNSLTFYFNGSAIDTITGSQATISQLAQTYLILDLGVGGWPGEPVSGSITSANPAVIQTDWVRVWQHPSNSNNQVNWVGSNGATLEWDDSGNWSGGVATQSNDLAYLGVLSNNPAKQIIDWSGSRTVNSFAISSPTNYVIGATATAWNAGSGPAIMLAPVDGVPTAAETVYINSYSSSGQGSTTFNARLEVPFSLLTLSINNGVTAPMTFNGDLIGPGNVTFNSGSIVLNGNDTTTGNHTFANGVALTLNGQISAAYEFLIASGTVQANSSSTIVANAWMSVGSTTGGTGTLNLSGGSVTANTDLNIGDVTGSHGIVNMTGGSINCTNFYLGKSGTATGLLVQTGGSIGPLSGTGGDWRIGGAASASDSAAVGTYNLSGGTFTDPVNLQVGAYGHGTINQTGGTVTVGDYLSIGRFTGSVGVYNMASGSGTLTANTVAALIVGEQGTGTLLVGGTSHVNAKLLSIGHSDGTNATGTVVQTGGTVTATTGVEFGTAASGSAVVNGTYTLSGGTLATPSVTQNPLSTVTGTFNFNGGVLQPASVATSLFTGVTNLRVQAGGALINAAGLHLTLAETMTHDPALGATPDGGLTKGGFNTLTIAVPQAYTGPTSVTAGTLQLSSGPNLLPATGTFNLINAGSTLDLNGFNQTLAALNGLSGSLVTLGAGTLTINNTAADTFGGNISGTGGLTKSSAGLLTLGGTSTYTGATNISAGTVAIPSGAALIGTAVTVANGATLNVTGSLSATTPAIDNGTANFTANTATTPLARPVGAITVGPAATLAVSAEINHNGRQVIQAASLGLNPTATLNLGNNDLDITSASLQTITSLVAAGYKLTAGATWTGTGITSTTAAADTSHLTALGVIQNNQNGPPIYSVSNPFDTTAPAAADVLVKYTYFGDANLDGVVDGSDYSLIDAGYASHQPGHAGPVLTGWLNGDFNYDGTIDGSDYALIDNVFNNQSASYTGGSTALVATTTAEVSAQAGVQTAVPEPAALAAMLAVAAITPRRVRRPGPRN